MMNKKLISNLSIYDQIYNLAVSKIKVKQLIKFIEKRKGLMSGFDLDGAVRVVLTRPDVTEGQMTRIILDTHDRCHTTRLFYFTLHHQFILSEKTGGENILKVLRAVASEMDKDLFFKLVNGSIWTEKLNETQALEGVQLALNTTGDIPLTVKKLVIPIIQTGIVSQKKLMTLLKTHLKTLKSSARTEVIMSVLDSKYAKKLSREAVNSMIQSPSLLASKDITRVLVALIDADLFSVESSLDQIRMFSSKLSLEGYAQVVCRALMTLKLNKQQGIALCSGLNPKTSMSVKARVLCTAIGVFRWWPKTVIALAQSQHLEGKYRHKVVLTAFDVCIFNHEQANAVLEDHLPHLSSGLATHLLLQVLSFRELSSEDATKFLKQLTHKADGKMLSRLLYSIARYCLLESEPLSDLILSNMNKMDAKWLAALLKLTVERKLVSPDQTEKMLDKAYSRLELNVYEYLIKLAITNDSFPLEDFKGSSRLVEFIKRLINRSDNSKKDTFLPGRIASFALKQGKITAAQYNGLGL